MGKPPRIQVQTRVGRPTVEELQKASFINITDTNNDVYELRWGMDQTSFTISGGMFSEKRTYRCCFNTVMNVPEVIFALASGERFVNLLLGSNSPFKKAYVRLGIQKVETKKDEN